MKKVLFISCLLFIGCSEDSSEHITISKEEYKKLKGDTMLPEYPKKITVTFSVYPSVSHAEIIMVDSCEYIIGRDAGIYNGGIFMTHKGNCKNTFHKIH